MDFTSNTLLSSASLALPDVQSSHDGRHIGINSVGIRGVRHPLQVRSKQQQQATIATLEMAVALPPAVKGTHMSRFIQLLQETPSLGIDDLDTLLSRMLARLEAEHGLIRIKFPYFVRKTAPVSHTASLMDYEVLWEIEQQAESAQGQEKIRRTLWQTLIIPVMSLCPCSRDISDYGAHNQRSHLRLSAQLSLNNATPPLSLEEHIAFGENAASSPLWSILKRPDEKYVTEYSYNHPKFVEDLVRDIALAMRADPRVLHYRVEAENFESIHNHSAFAVITA